jgi:hypothetical protein
MLRFWRHIGPPFLRLQSRIACLLIAVGLLQYLSSIGRALEPTFRDDMDGAQPILRLLDTGGFTLRGQYIDRNTQGLSGGIEVVQFEGPAGESAHLIFHLPTAPVIAELQYAAMIRCNRPGVQIAARVVLPRSLNSKTGAPHEILLRGGNISRGLPSEKLVLDQLPKLLERQARVARLQTADSIDEREAYVADLIFLVPGGSGITEFGVDWIELYGILQSHKVDPNLELATAEEELFAGPTFPSLPTEQSTPTAPLAVQPIVESSPVNRIIEWQGESFEWLARLGFNTIWLPQEATATQLEDAKKTGMTLVCTPPPAEILDQEGISDKWKPILAWDLGQLIARDDLQNVKRLEQLIQQHDPEPSRLTIMRCEQLSRDASRVTDAIVLGREVLGTDLTLQDYVTWIGQRQRIARPGTPIWATVETEFSPLRAQQAAALAGSLKDVAYCASYEQLAAMTAAAMSVKCRDYVFSSESSLAANNPAARQRARNLELINMRLRLLTPWLATGKITGVGRSSEPGLTALVFQAERSHLLIPINWSRNFRSQQSLYVDGPVSFVVPGVAETTDVYLLTLAGTKRLRHERTTGGLQVNVDSLPADGMIMLTSDAQAFSQVSQYLRKIGGRATRLHRDAMAQRLDDVENAAAVLAKEANGVQAIKAALSRARMSLAICDRDLQNGYIELAYARTGEVDKLVSQAEYVLRNNSGSGSMPATPLEFHIRTLEREQQLKSSLASSTASPKLVCDFENLQGLLQAGWRHQQLAVPGVTSAVRLCPDFPHQGSYCLELEAAAADSAAPVTVVPNAPVWIQSPAIDVRAGELIEITGFARVEEELIGTVDGLEIVDSLGGPGMATRIKVSPNWQEFRILRGVPADGQLVVSVALSGLGRAQVDDLFVRSFTASGTVANSAEPARR